jgi:hypothetical protein
MGMSGCAEASSARRSTTNHRLCVGQGITPPSPRRLPPQGSSGRSVSDSRESPEEGKDQPGAPWPNALWFRTDRL